MKDEDLLEAPDDYAFLHSLRISCARVNGVYPPLALVEAFVTEDDHTPRVRRLHLIIVDMTRRRRLATRVSKQLLKVQIDECVAQCWNTLPIPCKHDQAAYQLRYVFAYAMDGTDLPCYILWPVRTEDNSFWCIDAWKGDWVQLDRCGYMAPVGIEQFFDAFSLDPKRPWRTIACQALGIPAGHIAEDTHINPSEGSKFTLTPRRIPVERRTIAEKNTADVIMKDGEESGSGADIVDGLGSLTTHLLILKAPFWRPRRWPLTKTGLTLHMRPFGIFLRASVTSTPGSMRGGSPVMTHLASC